MKRIFVIAAIAACFVACNNDKSTSVPIKDSGSSLAGDAMKNDSAAAAVPAPVMSEGDMMMKGGKMMLMKNGQWTEITETITNANGDRVMANGDIVMKSGMKMKITEGEAIKTNGIMLDKDGQLMDMGEEK